MIIGLLSDSHGNTGMLKSALDTLIDYKTDAIVHCGDICDISSLRLLADTKVPVWLVAGNMDSHILHKLELYSQGTNVTFEHHTAEILLENGEHLIATHGDNELLMEELIAGEKFPYICQGHTHKAFDTQYGSTRLICPGAISGPRFPNFPTAAVLNTALDKIDFYDISTPGSPANFYL